MATNTKTGSTVADQVLSSVPGAKPSERIDAWWGLVAAVVALVIFLVVFVPDPFGRAVAFVADGIGVTVIVTVMSFIFVMIVGLLGGLGRISGVRAIRGFTSLYVEVIRGIPLLVQLLFWYYALPQVIQTIGQAIGSEALIHFQADPILFAIIGLTIGYGAYMTEVVRAGIQSVPRGQMEAGRSLGLTYVQAMRYVVLPQAFRTIMPAIGNEFVTLLKDSSLVSVVAVADLTRRGREFMSMTFLPLQTWAMVALLYLVMTLFAARIVSWLEKKTKIER